MNTKVKVILNPISLIGHIFVIFIVLHWVYLYDDILTIFITVVFGTLACITYALVYAYYEGEVNGS